MQTLKMYRAGVELLIDPQNRLLQVYQGGQLAQTYPVAVGKRSTPTPAGEYKVINKVTNPGGVLGTRWMGLNIPGGNYGIHGTNNPASIGTYASMGCIRMQNYNVEELFPQIPVGTPVRIASVPGYNHKGISSQGSDAPLDHSSYVVRSGDTLWKIAQKYNLSLDTLLAENPLVNPNALAVGQVIQIPQ